MACESTVTQKSRQVRYYLLNVSTSLCTVPAYSGALPKPEQTMQQDRLLIELVAAVIQKVLD